MDDMVETFILIVFLILIGFEYRLDFTEQLLIHEQRCGRKLISNKKTCVHSRII